MSVDQEVWNTYKCSCVHRLLNGAGQVALAAYHEESAFSLTAAAHDITADGSLVVTTAEFVFVEALANRSVYVVDIRVPIERESPDPTIEIVMPTVHFPGTAR